MAIPKNEVINKNIEMLLGNQFTMRLINESIGGNAGEMHAGVNAHYSPLGEIVRFSNYPDEKKEGEKGVTFSVDVGYMLKTSYLSKKDRWIIDGIYFDDKNENEDVKSVIENAADYANKLSKKDRKERKNGK